MATGVRAWNGRRLEWGVAAETAGVFTAIMLYIWRLRSMCWGCWVVILGLILVTHWLRNETPWELGFRVAGLGHSLAAVVRPLLVVAAGLLAASAASGALGGLTAGQAGLSLVRYLAWGLFQQYLLNGYFVNRLQVLFGSREKGCAAAAIFSACISMPSISSSRTMGQKESVRCGDCGFWKERMSS